MHTETEKPVHVLRVPKHGGGKLRVGNPGNKNKGGRPTNRFKKWCQRQLERPDLKRAVRKMMRRAGKTGDTEELRKMMELLSRYAHHELVQQRDVKVTGAKEVLETLNEAMDNE